MSRRLLALVLLSTLVAIGGCVRTPGGVAPSTIPLAPGGYTVLGPVKASDCKVDLLGLIPVSGGNRLDQAIEKAKRKRDADALIEILIDRDTKYFVLWSQVCTVVRAIAVRVS